RRRGVGWVFQHDEGRESPSCIIGEGFVGADVYRRERWTASRPPPPQLPIAPGPRSASSLRRKFDLRPTKVVRSLSCLIRTVCPFALAKEPWSAIRIPRAWPSARRPREAEGCAAFTPRAVRIRHAALQLD